MPVTLFTVILLPKIITLYENNNLHITIPSLSSNRVDDHGNNDDISAMCKTISIMDNGNINTISNDICINWSINNEMVCI